MKWLLEVLKRELCLAPNQVVQRGPTVEVDGEPWLDPEAEAEDALRRQ